MISLAGRVDGGRTWLRTLTWWATVLLFPVICHAQPDVSNRSLGPVPGALEGWQTFQAQEGLCAFAPEISKPLTLSEAVERALCASENYRKAWAIVRQRAADVGIDRAALLPSLVGALSEDSYHRTIQTEVSFFDANMKYTQPTLDVNLQVPVFDFGHNLAKIRQARQLLVAARADAQNALFVAALAAADAYYKLHIARADLASDQESRDAAARTLDVVNGRASGGAASLTDKLSAQTALLQAEAQVVTSRSDLQDAEGVLALAMGLDANTRVTLDESDTNGMTSPVAQCAASHSVQELINIAARDNPQLQAARAELDAAEQGVRAAVTDGLPSISLRSHYQWIDERFGTGNEKYGIDQIPITNLNRIFSIGLQVQIPLFDGGARSNHIRSARALVMERAATLAQLQRDVTLDLWKSHGEMQSNCCEIPDTLAQLLSTATQSRAAAHARYKNGVGDILEILEAEKSLANARKLQIEHRSACHTALLKASADLGSFGY
jgi:outer membrane protein